MVHVVPHRYRVPVHIPCDRETILRNLLTTGAMYMENVFSQEDAFRMAQSACGLNYIPQVGEFGKRQVRLDRVSNTLIPPGVIDRFYRDLQRKLNDLFGPEAFPEDEGKLSFDDRSLQFYPHCSSGIQPHLDERPNRLLIVLVTLCGQGRFRIYPDLERLDEPILDIRTQPGSVHLMVGPGFMGRDYRPLHGVDEIVGTPGYENWGRIIVSLRAAPGYDCFRPLEQAASWKRLKRFRLSR